MPPVSAFAAISSGTGFFVTADGYFLTCFHAVDGAERIVLRGANGSLFDATVVAVDRSNDLAILKANGKFSPQPMVDAAGVRPGTSVSAVGFPDLDAQSPETRLTRGVVSSLSGVAEDPGVFQITVAVEPGNCAGPLVAHDGDVVGIVTEKLDTLKASSAAGDRVQRVNYGVKSSRALALLSSIPDARYKLPRPSGRQFADISDLAPMVEKAVALVIVDNNRLVEERQAREREQADRIRGAREKEELRRAEAARKLESEQAQ